ncbi:hypothetical protein C2S51_021282 [Perilla frutescens var. frutescens]|nr:hypothetical protein C2S51_021282 [Perilla frutescens var. frutescens]
MVSLDDSLHSLSAHSDEAGSSPRISFSSEFFDESNFITICPNPQAEREREAERARAAARNVDFEFLSGNLTDKMITADELISEGKLLPFWQIHHAEKLSMISLKSDGGADKASQEIEASKLKEESRISWFIDEDPSPRPPKCTVLWKELLKLKKQRPSTLSPSISSSSSSSSSSSRISVADIPSGDERKERNMREKVCSKRGKKGQERERSSRSVSIRIRPVLNVPICTAAAKNAAALPPLFSLRKGKLDS